MRRQRLFKKRIRLAYLGRIAETDDGRPVRFLLTQQSKIFVIQRLPLHRLGFHQISAGGAAIPLDHEIYDVVAAFIDAMGVSSDHILTAMRDTPPRNMYYPPYQWLCDANAGWFYGNCTQPHP